MSGEQWAITKCFWVKSLIWQVFEIVRKVNINWDFIRFLDLVSRVHIWRRVHLRKCVFYTPETEKALCWALCAIVANRNTSVRCLTTPPPTRRVCDTCFSRCMLFLKGDHGSLACGCTREEEYLGGKQGKKKLAFCLIPQILPPLWLPSQCSAGMKKKVQRPPSLW